MSNEAIELLKTFKDQFAYLEETNWQLFDKALALLEESEFDNISIFRFLNADVDYDVTWPLEKKRAAFEELRRVEQKGPVEKIIVCQSLIYKKWSIWLEKELEEWRNKEAAICPEDVGFEEYIKSLQSKLAEAKKEKEILNKRLGELASEDMKKFGFEQAKENVKDGESNL